MYRVIVSPTAMTDVDRLENWLLEHDTPYGLELGAKLADASATLINYPERAPISRSGRYRELYVAFHSNQYVIQYRVRDLTVVIARVFHSLERR
jgi:plasmid stabilization system protein ParE